MCIFSEFGTPRRAVLTSSGSPVVSTDKGFLVMLRNTDVIDSFHDVRFVSYCILSNSKDRNLMVIGGITGEIVLFRGILLLYLL